MEATRFTVNGTQHVVQADPKTPLLDVLRDVLDLKGTRFGCGAGECGACHVLVDGVSQAACNLPLWALQGKALTTVEGLPPALADAFVAEQALQCGYCGSGVLVAAAALLRRLPRPDGCGRAQRARRPPVPLRRAQPHRARGAARSAEPAMRLQFNDDGTVLVRTGKVELGQGILTALTQIAAHELGIAPERVQVLAADTLHGPDEGVTSGSNSVHDAGAALRQACVQARERASGLRDAAAAPAVVGQSLPRVDLPAKLAGRPSYIHDLSPRWPAARPRAAPAAAGFAICSRWTWP